MNPVYFFEKCNCGDYEALFRSPSYNLYFLFQGVSGGEQCVFADSNIDKFAFSTVDAQGNVLTPQTALFPSLYGWPEIDDCTTTELWISWEGDAPVMIDCSDFVAIPIPEYSPEHYPVV